jgi:UDPglucose--hexose-1-phosphate uridylyltransferase
VIESPEHSCALAQQPPEQVERTLAAIQHRVSALEEDERIEAVVAFKNHGTAAGTSLEHPHWQILATPVVPPRLAVKQKIASEHFGRSSKCLYREVLAHELAAAQRVLEADEHHVAYVPFASRFPYSVRIVPREPLATFAGAAPETLASLAKMLRSVLGALDRHLGDPAFNLTIESAPVAFRDSSSFSWHIDVLPRLARLAGFELASGMSINPVLPETAARELYQALARQGNGRP